MDDICYLIEAVDTIIDTLDKLIVSGDISSDFQTVMCKLDYLQRLVVNLDLDDSLSEMVGAAYTLMSDIDRRNQAHSSGYKASVQWIEMAGVDALHMTLVRNSFHFYFIKASIQVILANYLE